MAVFLVLAGFVAFILYRQISSAFMANPGLNALIVGVMLIGVVLAIRQVWRLFPEVRWVNTLSHDEEARPPRGSPDLLAPMATLITNRSHPRPVGRHLPARSSIVGARLDESREIVRYLAGLLVFLGLLGTFWGLIDTVGSVGRIIGSLRTGQDATVLFDELKNLAGPPSQGMGLSFSASLFGLAGSLVLGFLDLQAGQAQSRFYTELEDWLASSTSRYRRWSRPRGGPPPELAVALNRLTARGGRGCAAAGRHAGHGQPRRGHPGARPAHARRQQMTRDWVEAQATREKELKQVLERLASRTGLA